MLIFTKPFILVITLNKVYRNKNRCLSILPEMRGLELDGIISTLNTLIDFSGTKVSEEVINQFVYRVTPTSDTTFDWYVNLNGTATGSYPLVAKYTIR